MHRAQGVFSMVGVVQQVRLCFALHQGRSEQDATHVIRRAHLDKGSVSKRTLAHLGSYGVTIEANPRLQTQLL